MKKLILVFIAIAITAGAYAQADSTNRKMDQRVIHYDQNPNVQYHPDKSPPDGVMMQNGKMMRVNNGQTTILQDNDMTMSNGTKVKSDGTCIHKDGTKMMMKEGQHMDMSGNMIHTKMYNDKSMDHNQHMQNNSMGKSYPDGVLMQNGKIMRVTNGHTTYFQDNDMTMSNGTRIMNDGTIVNKDGTRTMMYDGQHMDMSGNLIHTKMYNDKTMDHNQHMQNNPMGKSYPDGVLMQNGKMMRVTNGHTTYFQDNDMTMSNGTRIMSDGTIVKKDGSRTMMYEGQHMDMSGNMIHTKTNKDNNMYLVPDSTINR